ncbi:hypothetical protein ISF_05731 [Cordyceps fumosorosea ARSEF 2679]|uniref:Uncharacterized protein n=1 Tax=Cordyceps fumosorosea (strain ARSEF 2679) TaxID=1081104 RepID=A0A167TKF9_CORFA|nr:hypothetical protein ISF_05731 [Cordyceps fumosorosea ARSEF 2679]OAA60692.1 hypothetical protein ISF_05731 [Cordyceps fumosorosea ARSEF 2679]
MASNKTHLYVVPNKNRLYVTVYPDDDAPDDKESFSWGFLIGPKHEDTVINPGVRYYIDRSPVPATSEHPEGSSGGGGRSFRWRYAEDALPSIKCPARMYARILIAKIEDEDRLERLLRETPRPRAPEEGEDNPLAAALRVGYNSQVWASQVLARLAGMGRKRKDRIVGTAVLDWHRIEQTARWYVAEKMAADRYNEDYLRETQHRLPKPTWDMLLDREIAG